MAPKNVRNHCPSRAGRSTSIQLDRIRTTKETVMIEAAKSLLRRVRTRLCETDLEFIRLRGELATVLDNRNDPCNEFAALATVNSPLRGRVYADFSELEKSVYRRSISVASAGGDRIADASGRVSRRQANPGSLRRMRCIQGRQYRGDDKDIATPES